MSSVNPNHFAGLELSFHTVHLKKEKTINEFPQNFDYDIQLHADLTFVGLCMK